MNLKNIKIQNFRNIKNISIDLNENINIFYGDNAQGKTNLIEAIWLLSGFKSFRTNKDNELIKLDENYFYISSNFFYKNLHKIEYSIFNNKKIIKLNGENSKSFRNLKYKPSIILFTSEDINIIKGQPEFRRNFLDISISQIKPNYIDALNQYNKILKQKNNLLKNFLNKTQEYDLIEILNLQLAKIGTFIHCTRINFLNNLESISKNYYYDFTNGKENISLDYKSSIFLQSLVCYNDENINYYYETLNKSIHNDIKYKTSTLGIHKDDFKVYINNLDTRKFSSQGQKRSCVIIFKISLCDIFKNNYGYFPIILLDDVMSELDKQRISFLFNNIKKMQVIITSCDNSLDKFLNKNHSVFNIKNGFLI